MFGKLTHKANTKQDFTKFTSLLLIDFENSSIKLNKLNAGHKQHPQRQESCHSDLPMDLVYQILFLLCWTLIFGNVPPRLFRQKSREEAAHSTDKENGLSIMFSYQSDSLADGKNQSSITKQPR